MSISGLDVVEVVQERILSPHWAPELIALSFCTSWLGSYTSTQLHIHAQYTRSRLTAWLCAGAGSLAFGFCAIWSMHFLGMLACGLDVKIAFDLPLTILSAVVAVGFTFVATFTSDLSLFLPQRTRRQNDPEAPASPAFLRCDSDVSREDDGTTDPRADEHDTLLPPDARDAGVSWDVLEERVSEGGSLPGDMKSSIWTSWYKRGRAHIIKLVVRAAIWATAIVFMHYCGMWAMVIPEGRIEWDLRTVVLSYFVAFAVTFVACILMFHMHYHLGRQIASSTIAAAGVCAMHYTGMAAATFYTRAPPNPDAGYPAYIPYTIISIAVVVCVVSNAVLANTAILSRNRMAESIHNKRKLWKLTAEKDAAQRSEALKQQFISVASHEIRTPLHTVSGYVELLMRTELSADQTQYVSSIQQACHTINVIAGNVLDFSKLERDNVELEARPVLVDPHKMLDSLARMSGGGDVETSQPAVEKIFSVAPEVPPTIYLDETYTLRVLMNLLSNAQKFTDIGFITVTLGTHPSSQQLIARVADSGCGIPVHSRKTIFEPYQQADTSLTRAHQGTGLGLSIVKHLVQRMGGTIAIDSVPSVGSTFAVALPLRPGAEKAGAETARVHRRRRVKVLSAHAGAADAFAQCWRIYGCDAKRAAMDCAAEELAADADVLWADLHAVAVAPGLQHLLRHPPAANPQLCVCIVAADRAEVAAALARFGVSLIGDLRLRVVTRPVLMHHVLRMLDSPNTGEHTNDPPSPTPPAYDARKDVVDSISTLVPLGDDVHLEKQVVLLVEDNLVNQRLGKRLVEKMGFTVVTADDGQAAVDIVQRMECHLCLMDCQMPVLDGFAATQQIRQLEASGVLPRRLRVIALTANVTAESEDECRAAGMDAFLPKPLRYADLEAALHGL